MTPHSVYPNPLSFVSCCSLPGPPLSEKSALGLLAEHGVKVGMGATDKAEARNMRFDVAWVSRLFQTSGFPEATRLPDDPAHLSFTSDYSTDPHLRRPRSSQTAGYPRLMLSRSLRSIWKRCSGSMPTRFRATWWRLVVGNCWSSARWLRSSRRAEAWWMSYEVDEVEISGINVSLLLHE